MTISILTTKPTNKPTKAWLKADIARTERFATLEKLVSPDYSATAFLGFNANNKPYAVLFRGRSLKPVSSYYYQSIDRREEMVINFFTKNMKNKLDNKGTNSAFEVGQIIYASWGWEQTNIDFYKIIKLVGKTMVEIVEIAKERTPNGDMTGHSLPLVDKIIGEPMRRKVQLNEYVGINSFTSASKLDKNDDGSYVAKAYSSYA